MKSSMMAIIVNIFNILDIATTYVAIVVFNLPEQNALMSRMFACIGFAMSFWIKQTSVLFITMAMHYEFRYNHLLWKLTGKNHCYISSKLLLAACCWIMAIVVAGNVIEIGKTIFLKFY